MFDTRDGFLGWSSWGLRGRSIVRALLGVFIFRGSGGGGGWSGGIEGVEKVVVEVGGIEGGDAAFG